MLATIENEVLRLLYNSLADIIVKTYDNFTASNHTYIDKNDYLISFDNYMQNIILQTVLLSRGLEEGEFNFVKSIVKFSDGYKDLSVLKSTNPNTKFDDLIKKESRRRLDIIPDFIYVFYQVDKEFEHSTSKVSFCKFLYDRLVEIINFINSDDSKIGLEVLKTLIAFFESHNISLK